MYLMKGRHKMSSCGDGAVRAGLSFAPQAEGLEFESQPRQTQVVKTSSDSSTATCLAFCASVTGPRRL